MLEETNEIINSEEARQTNEILNSLEQQVQDREDNGKFVYAVFIVVGLSMIFEYFVRNYKTEIQRRKEEEKEYKDIRKKLYLTYALHLVFMIALGLIVKFMVGLADVYTVFLLMVTFYIVEFAPLFNFHFRKHKKEEK